MTETSTTVRAVVVDDSAATRRILIQILKNSDVDVVAEANDIESALDTCRRDRPDVVFLDVVMPGGSGVEVLRQVRELIPNVRVLMVTSIDGRDTVASCRDLGASGYILKPFSRDKVLKSVQALCANIRNSGNDEGVKEAP